MAKKARSAKSSSANRPEPRAKRPRFDLSRGLKAEIVAVVLLVVAGLMVLSILPLSRGGLTLGLHDLLSRSFGQGAFVLPLGLIVASAILFRGALTDEQSSWNVPFGGLLMGLSFLGLLHVPVAEGWDAVSSGTGGGYVGAALSITLSKGLGPIGGLVAILALGVVGVMVAFKLSVGRLGNGIWMGVLIGASLVARGFRWVVSAAAARFREWRAGRVQVVVNQAGKSSDAGRSAKGIDLGFSVDPDDEIPELRKPRPFKKTPEPEVAPPAASPPEVQSDWVIPSTEMLETTSALVTSESQLRDKGRLIERTLASFGVGVTVREINSGPTVTQYGIVPDTGVKVSKILSLQNDLALALEATTLRLEAPVPGRPFVGIEVPNSSSSLVGLRELLESKEFVTSKGKLPIALGRDVSGKVVVTDLAKMPHLLIAGTTGSGKSVCLNTIISSYLFHLTPHDLRFLMIDPKMIELTPYAEVPHQLAPVVIEPEKAVAVLKWATAEMERRYRVFAKGGRDENGRTVNFRNVESYNGFARKTGQPTMPYIVIIIDELADLMMRMPDEVETWICRLAQMARATGMHLIIATQRPSVDVVTGLIKANFPARIAFAVQSQIDSRVILDTGGAEKLLGRGDMLYVGSDAGKPVRVQGAFVSDRDVKKIVDAWRDTGAPQYDEGLMDALSHAGQDEQSDELLPEAIRIVRDLDRASVSLLQRRLRVGYNRAARLLEMMEEQGIVGPAEGGHWRTVYPEGEEIEPDEELTLRTHGT